MTTALGPGKLVIASGLTSSQGKRLNWNFGIVRDGETSEGRLEVEIFARVEGKKVTAEKSKPTVVLKYSNLKCMDDEVVLRKGHPTFMQYLRKKLSDTPLVQYLRKELSDMPLVHDGWEQVYKTCVELAAFPGFKADKDDKITIASSLYMTKRIPAATRVLKKMVKELSPSDPDRSQLFFVLTKCLIEGSRFGEALDAIDEIQMEAGEARKDYSDEKSATLVALVVKCEAKPGSYMSLLDRALHAFLVIHPHSGWAMHHIATNFFHWGKWPEAIQYFEIALERGKGLNGEAYEEPVVRQHLAVVRGLQGGFADMGFP